MTPRPLPQPPAVVGIVNVTPDSFSDGGRAFDVADAVRCARSLVADGAAALDLGAESTRPGALAVAPVEEWRRLGPVLRALREELDVPLSIDTRNAETAERALDAGADAINDVSTLRHDPRLAAVAARTGATLVVMHSRGTPATMRDLPRHRDVVRDVVEDLREALRLAVEAGCLRDQLVIDPGFGFAKTADEGVALLRGLPALLELGRPILVGLSRKSMLGSLLARDGAPREVDDRTHASVGAALAAWSLGASYLRVHDVRQTCDALAAFRAAWPHPPHATVAGAWPRGRGMDEASARSLQAARSAGKSACSAG